ncbi:MAG TPA: ROK family protein [Bryobacteraceae bacterium]|nr:ROK family protein [Bryobacteraceae bacterium]
MAKYAIGVDLGGTNYRAASIDESGKILDRVSGPTDSAAGREAILNAVVSAIVALRTGRGSEDLAGIGVALPGFIDIEKGFIHASPNVPPFQGFHARDALRERLGAPVILENDANAAALGEKWMGAGQSVNDLVLLTLGTGIGGGIISDGRVLHGFMGMAAELGHVTVDPFGNPCACGNTGCLEKHASATAISAMARYLNLGENLTAEQVYGLAAEGNEQARRVFEHMGTALGIGLANYIQIFNFPLYLLSGGVLPAWDYFAPAMLREIERRSLTYRSTDTRVEKAVLGSDAGLFGAACLPFRA